MLQALGKNLIVIAYKDEEKEKKLIIPIHEEKPLFWKVISMGEDVKKINIGDLVCTLDRYMLEVPLEDGTKAYRCNYEDIYAVRK